MFVTTCKIWVVMYVSAKCLGRLLELWQNQNTEYHRMLLEYISLDNLQIKSSTICGPDNRISCWDGLISTEIGMFAGMTGKNPESRIKHSGAVSSSRFITSNPEVLIPSSEATHQPPLTASNLTSRKPAQAARKAEFY